MTDRLTTLAASLGALALFLVLFVHGEGVLDPRRNVPRPTTAEPRGTGYRAAFAWLQASGLHAVSLRERFDTLLTRRDLARSGNVLVVTLPGTEAFRSAETRRLQEWIRAGNTLLVLAALADNPAWASAVGGTNVGDLKVLSGLDFSNAARRGQPARKAATILPNRAHVYFTDVGSARAAALQSQNVWSARIPSDSFVLALAHERDTGNAVLWTRLLGAGAIVVSGVAALFTDQALPLAGNAQLFANIVGVNLGKAGAVIFDDFHQGLTAAYDPQKFYSDPRLYLTSVILLALWFIWVLGATRLRIPVTRIAAPREADLVRANAGFLARVLPRDLAARRLFEHFFRHIARRMSLAQADGPWGYLATSPRIDAPDLEQLRLWHGRALAGDRVPLVRLYNLILRVERQIS
jgi:Domain of unknown function (DUF4350)